MKLHFECDYTEGAHPAVWERVLRANGEQNTGYGNDAYCAEAAGVIRGLCDAPDAEVVFVSGGTQANLVMLTAALRPHQGALCAESGHINQHESGAIEASGHKVLPLPASHGKITARQVQAYCAAHYADETREHMVQPGLVYLSQPTELGTLYTLDELNAMRKVCDAWGLLLYVDGARLAYALGAEENDIGLRDLAALCDAFYIGGTKCGTLFGEAIVICNRALQKDIFYIVKQRVGRFAKGWLMGLQFLALFEDGLYTKIGAEAVRLAKKLRDGFVACGGKLYIPSQTNQQFFIVPNTALPALSEQYFYSTWEHTDEQHTALRFCTSWATREEQIEPLLRALEKANR